MLGMYIGVIVNEIGIPFLQGEIVECWDSQLFDGSYYGVRVIDGKRNFYTVVKRNKIKIVGKI